MPEPEPLPPPARPRPPHAARADAGLVGLVILFALAAGSFVARNSDVWLHLAAGRLVAGGDYPFGQDPFAHTTAGVPWANHAWLFDLGLYLTFARLGPAAVVGLKAAAVALTAAIMLLTARGRAPVWVAAGCVFLAVLAMTPRLLLQPTVASFLLLAVSVYCLQAGGRTLRAVPPLIALWVNLDGWFLLGPLLVGLFWLGRRLDPDRAGLAPWPTWLVPASLAACLLSPHHVRAFTLPLELSPAVWASAFPSDPRFAGVFASPWQLTPLGPTGGYNLAAGAFFVLAALGAVSFAAQPRALLSWRGPVWLAFAALAAWQVRLVPFFAVVAGSITALNLGGVLPARAGESVGRGVVAVLGVALVGLGWFGKVTGFYNRDRGVAWAVHTDPTLARTAAAAAEWQDRAPAGAALFTAHPDVGHYLAWFAPGVRSSLDSRLTLFTGVAGEYRERSRALGLIPGEDAADAPGDVAAAVVYDPDPRRMTGALRVLAGGRWEVARVPGGAVLAVPKGTPLPLPRFRPEHAVFGTPGAGDIGPVVEGPAQLIEQMPEWELVRETGRRGSWEADAGTVYLRLFEGTADRSPALPLLALRAGRRGVEADPADATAWLVAARAALLLDTRSWERDAGEALTMLAFARHVAYAGGLVQAVRLNPDSAATHDALAGVYARRGFVDLAHRHAAEAHRLVTRAGPGVGEPAEAFAERAKRAADLAAEAERLMQDGENRYVIRTSGLPGDPLERARVAAELGLPQKGIDVLLGSHPDLYGTAGLALLADLLLQVGQLAEARTLLDRDEIRRNPASLGLFTLPGRSAAGAPSWVYRLPAYDWFDLCQCAGVGRYAGAAAAADRMRAHLAAEERQFTPPVLSALSGQVGRTAGVAAALAGPGGFAAVPLVPTAARESQRLAGFLSQVRFLGVARADLSVLAGVLELERGNPAGAADRFRAALPAYAAARGGVPALPGEALATRYLELIDRHR